VDSPADYHPDSFDDLQLGWEGRSTVGTAKEEDTFEYIKDQNDKHSHEQDYITDAPTHEEWTYEPISLKMDKIKAKHAKKMQKF
jgi:hypothetical protein